MIKTNISVVVFLFNTFKDTRFVENFMPKTKSMIRHNSNITMLALTLSFVYKMLKNVY